MSRDYLLQPFPATPAPPAGTLRVTLAWLPTGALQLEYHIDTASALRIPAPIPAPAASGPADALWRQTCCEMFIAAVDAPEYREFNFSPSGQWAIYDFSDYRQRRDGGVLADTPRLHWQASARGGLLQARIARPLLPNGPWQLGLAVILEDEDGRLSYWALRHAGECPDFHRRESFTLDLDLPLLA